MEMSCLKRFDASTVHYCSKMYVMCVMSLLQGFDSGRDTYREPPVDASGCQIDIDPNRSVRVCSM